MDTSGSNTCARCGASLPSAGAAGSELRCRFCGLAAATNDRDAGRTTEARSLDSRRPAAVTFVNKLNCPVEVVWLDYEGREQSYGRIELGAHRSFNTYVGHVWSLRVAGTNGEILRWAAPDERARDVAIV